MTLSNDLIKWTLPLFVIIALGNTALAAHPARLDEYDRLMGTFDSLHPERFEMVKTNPNAPQSRNRLFTAEEYAVAKKNNTVAYEAAVRMGLFSGEAQRQMGITRIDVSESYSLTIYTQDNYGTWKYFLTSGDFDQDFIRIISLAQDNMELAKTTQIHLSSNHSNNLKQGVDMWLYIESKSSNEYTGRSEEVVKTQVKITSNDLIDPKGLYERRIEDTNRQRKAQTVKKASATPRPKALTCEAIFGNN